VLLGARLLPFLSTPGIAAAAVLIPTALLVRGDVPLRPSIDTEQWRALLSPILTYSVAVAAATLYFRVAIVLVSLLASSRQLGFFSISLRVVEVLFAVPGLLVGAAFPIFARAARDDPARLGYALSRVFEVSLIVGAWMALSLAVGAHLAIELVGGSKFLPAAPILAVQGLALGATFVSTVWGFGMLSLHLHRLILIFSVGSLLIVIAVVSVLVTLDGAQGAAIGTSAVEIGVAIASGLLLVKGRPHLRPRLTGVPKVALAAALGATPMLATGLPVIVRLLLSTLIYGVVVFALRAFPTEVYDLLPARLRGRG
jgi:O-antigen/teichoic acid export membrane protein